MLSSFFQRSSTLHSTVSRQLVKSLSNTSNRYIAGVRTVNELYCRLYSTGNRFFATRGEENYKNGQLEKVKKQDLVAEEPLGLTRKPDFSPIPVLSKDQIAKISSTEVGMENLNISEGDLVEIDSIAKQFSDMINTPVSEEVYLDLKDINVDKTFNKIKDTLHIDDLPRAVKAIRVLSAQDRPEDALLIWNVIKQDPKQCTLLAWTAYLNTLCTHGNTRKAQEEVKEMILQGHRPNAHTYSIIVKGLVKEGLLDEAYSVARQMTENGIRPNNVTISSLMVGCIKKRQLDRARETFDLIDEYLEDVDSITIALMIKVSELAHQTEKAIRYFNSLEVRELPVTQGCYHAIMHACAASWRYDVKAFDYFEKMVGAGIKPTLTSFHILLEACAQHGDFVKVNDIFAQIHEAGLKPTAATYSFALRAIAEAGGKDLAMPEHPAGDRRLTRKEYERILKGYEKPQQRDRTSYVRDIRGKDMDDGLGDVEEHVDEPAPSTELVQNEVNLKKMFKESEERVNQPIATDMIRSLKAGMQKVNEEKEERTRSSGLSEAEINEVIDRANGVTPAVVERKPTLQDTVNQIVASDYLIDNPSSDHPKQVREDYDYFSSIKDLAEIEKEGRHLILEEYTKKGGDPTQIDYTGSAWNNAIVQVMSHNNGFHTSIQNMVKTKMGLTALAGSKLLKEKEQADEEFKKEVSFLVSCFRENPEKASSLTQLRLAKEINKDILDQYTLLSAVEPNQVYRNPTKHYALTVPNRVKDLSDYWHRLYLNDKTIPPLKPYLVNEGEKLWKQILLATDHKPSLVALNNHLSLYTKGCMVQRAETAFKEIQKYGQKPDVFSYHLLISMYAKTKRLKESATYMRKMQVEDGLTPSPETYGEMIIGLSRVGDVNTALAVMTDIKRQGLPYPKERYLKPLRMLLHKMDLDDHPSMPEDKERKQRENAKRAFRKDNKKTNWKVGYAASVK